MNMLPTGPESPYFVVPSPHPLPTVPPPLPRVSWLIWEALSPFRLVVSHQPPLKVYGDTKLAWCSHCDLVEWFGDVICLRYFGVCFVPFCPSSVLRSQCLKLPPSSTTEGASGTLPDQPCSWRLLLSDHFLTTPIIFYVVYPIQKKNGSSNQSYG